MVQPFGENGTSDFEISIRPFRLEKTWLRKVQRERRPLKNSFGKESGCVNVFRVKFSRIGIFFASFVTLALAPSCATSRSPAPVVNPWSEVLTPAPGPAASIGGYSAGCLAGGTKLPAEGEGYQTVYSVRNRHYGHPFLTSFLEKMGKVVHRARERPFLVGDLSMPRGGPTLSGHASHQIGLDADIWFRRAERKLTPTERDSAIAISMVHPQTRYVDPAVFGTEQITLLRRFAIAKEVERIFVNPAIKKDLCLRHPKADWIRKLRPWYAHDYHFHLRLRCPEGEAHCVPSEALPAGNGCDETLEWWWSDEARLEGIAKNEKPLEPPLLPKACAAVLD